MHSMAVALSAGSKANIGTSQSEKAENREMVKSIHIMKWHYRIIRHILKSSPHHHHNFTFRLSRVPLVLLGEDIVERPRLQLCDVSQLAGLSEVLLRVLP